MTQETKHTGGELKVLFDKADNYLTILNPDGENICNLSEHYYEKCRNELFDNAEANAQRIVHTWNCHDELVEALKEAAEFIGNHSESWYKAGQALKLKCEKAINKTEGRE